MLTNLILPALLAGITGSTALAMPASRPAGIAPLGTIDHHALLQLAQFGDVEVYFDEYGRRVTVDAYTGEVLSVERPRGFRSRQEYRRAWRRRELGRSYEADIPYKPRPYANGQPLEEDPGYARQAEPAPEEYAYPQAPEAYPEEGGEPRIVRREPVERKPLDAEPDERSAAVDPESTGTATLPSTDGATQPSISFGSRDEVASLQILLDRKGASPGVVDGRFGSNVDKALAAYREISGDNLHSTDTARIKDELAATGGDAFTQYTITPEDAAGPFVASVPADYSAKAKLDRLSFTSVPEMLAERFHMDEAYLKAINPDANFGRPGTIIKVANVGVAAKGQVARIVADKGRKQVRAYGADGRMIVAYPATIGSGDTPSPSGTHAVSRIALDPEYTYNPNLNFKQGDNDKILTIPPGPNGPVGSVWIALDKPTYGIHGTPDPSKIGKTESHGCVRLTNWDAAELAKMVKAGVEVEFLE